MGGSGKMGSMSMGGEMGGLGMGGLGMGGDAGMGGMSGAGGGGGGTSHSHPGTAFEGSSGGDLLIEEFGAVAGAGGGAMGGFGSLGGSGSSMMSEMGSPKSGSGAKSSASTKEVRYVDDAGKDQGYKTRAFLLDVLIRDERLPDLLAKLSNSDFPVEIVRVEIKSRSVGGGGGISGGYSSGEGMSGGYGGGEGMSGGYGGSSMSGSGMGMLSGESPGGISGGLGKGGGISPGMGRGAGMGNSFSGLGGMQSEGGYTGEGGGGIGMMGAGAAIGAEALNAAMADPLLIDVRIGGLLTLYMTPEESETQAKTEEAAVKEAEKSTPTTAVPGASDTPATAVPGASDTPTTAVPGASDNPTAAVPGASVPDASAVGPTAVDGGPGQSLSSQGADPKPAGDGTPVVPAGESVPPETTPPGTPLP